MGIDRDNAKIAYIGDERNEAVKHIIKKVIDIYFALNDNAALVPLYLEAVKLQPNDARLWASLAAGYANLGQYSEARTAAAKVLELNPDDRAKIEEFLKTLP